PANLQRLSRVGRKKREPHLLWSQNADDMADHDRLDFIGQLSCGRSRVLATLVEKISRTRGNHQDGHWQHCCCDRFHLSRCRRDHRGERRNESFNGLAHYVPPVEQHRVCKRFSRLTGALRACRARCIVGHHHRHLVSSPLCREQPCRLDRPPFTETGL